MFRLKFIIVTPTSYANLCRLCVGFGSLREFMSPGNGAENCRNDHRLHEGVGEADLPPPILPRLILVTKNYCKTFKQLLSLLLEKHFIGPEVGEDQLNIFIIAICHT